MNIKIHPLADILPAMSEREYQSLKHSIELTGQQEPILVMDGLLVAGRHRLKACNELGIEPKINSIKSNGKTPMDMVVAMDFARRNMNTSAKACAAAEVIEYVLKNRESGLDKLLKFNSSVKGVPRKEWEKGAIGTAAPKVPRATKEGRTDIHAELARLLGIGISSVGKARTLFLHDKDMFHKVKAGTITIETGYKEYRLKIKTHTKTVIWRGGQVRPTAPKKFLEQRAAVETSKIEMQPPSPFSDHSVIWKFIMDMNDKGWNMAMKVQDRKVYVHWYGNGVIDRRNDWTSHVPEPDFKRAVITEACQLLNKKAAPTVDMSYITP